MGDKFMYSTPQLLIYKFPVSIDIIIGQKFKHCLFEPTNQDYKKYPKFLTQRIREGLNKTLGKVGFTVKSPLPF